MADLPQMMQQILSTGKVDSKELELLRQALYADGRIDRREADFLAEVHKRLQRSNNAFEQFFYKAIRDHVLADGTIDAEETAWLRQLLFADGTIDAREKKFLRELRGEAQQVSPEFEALCAECLVEKTATDHSHQAGRG